MRVIDPSRKQSKGLRSGGPHQIQKKQSKFSFKYNVILFLPNTIMLFTRWICCRYPIAPILCERRHEGASKEMLTNKAMNKSWDDKAVFLCRSDACQENMESSLPTFWRRSMCLFAVVWIQLDCWCCDKRESEAAPKHQDCSWLLFTYQVVSLNQFKVGTQGHNHGKDIGGPYNSPPPEM